MSNAMTTAFDSLAAGLDRQHVTVTEAIDALVVSHQHGGKEAFDDRVEHLRGAVANMVLTVDSLRQVASHMAGMPAAAPGTAPALATPSAPALDAVNQPATASGLTETASTRHRGTRTAVAEGA